MRKILNAAWAVIAHAIVLLTAHHLATHFGSEILSLVRDEWLVGIADIAMGQ